MKKEIQDTKKIICQHCGHKWNTKSKAIKVTCPNCQHKTNREKDVIQFDVQPKLKGGK